MEKFIDSAVVLAYFIIVFVVGFVVSKRHKKGSAHEFITGGRSLSWKRTGLTLIAMMVDPAIMGISSLSFIWGFYLIQWNGVNFWITGWFAAMFFIGIYWRTRITTTPEYLEKRFNVHTRSFFSILQVVAITAMLGYAIYMGALLLEELLDWPFWINVFLISLVTGFYVIVGGTKTMLTIDFYQGIYLLITLLVMGIVSLVVLGGFSGIREITGTGEAGTLLKSMVPPTDLSYNTKIFFPLPAILTWAIIVGLSWLVCNFSMAQRLLAAKDEENAQKAILFGGVVNVLVNFLAYVVGIAARTQLYDQIPLGPEGFPMPDKAFIIVMFEKFPAGVTGLLVAGIIAALISTIDGMISSSSSLLTNDFYLRFINRKANGHQTKKAMRIAEMAIILLALMVVSLFIGSRSSFELIQSFFGDIMGVMIGLYLVGMFLKRITPNAAFFSMILSVALSVTLDLTTDINFAYIGNISFISVIVLSVAFSQFEKSPSTESLTDLTVWTMPGIKGPWIGISSWNNLRWWVIGLPMAWIIITLGWELYMQ